MLQRSLENHPLSSTASARCIDTQSRRRGSGQLSPPTIPPKSRSPQSAGPDSPVDLFFTKDRIHPLPHPAVASLLGQSAEAVDERKRDTTITPNVATVRTISITDARRSAQDPSVMDGSHGDPLGNKMPTYTRTGAGSSSRSTGPLESRHLQQESRALAASTPQSLQQLPTTPLQPPDQSADVVARMRNWRADAIAQNLYTTAAYWGDKLVSLTGEPSDVYWLAHTYFQTNQFKRASKLLSSNNYVQHYLPARYLAAQCEFKLGHYTEALGILGTENTFTDVVDHSKGLKYEASMCYLRGLVYMVQKNQAAAKKSFVEALELDVRCVEALEVLIGGQMLSVQDERNMLKRLRFDEHCGPNADLFRSLYMSKLRKYAPLEEIESSIVLLEKNAQLSQNSDVLLSRAELHFYAYEYGSSLQITKRILTKDQYNPTCLPLHISCLYETKAKNELFLLAHELVELFSDRGVSWFAVGSYYLLVGKHHDARHYFSKATTVQPDFAHGWVGFGHSFALSGEHDSAIFSYSTAAQQYQSNHTILMFIGMQHLQMNALPLAEEYLMLARGICTTDPVLENELGVLHYSKDNFELAVKFFGNALKLVDGIDLDDRLQRYSIRSARGGGGSGGDPLLQRLAGGSDQNRRAGGKELGPSWESTLTNLGHCYRRLWQLQNARSCYQKALHLDGNSAAACTGLGMISHAEGRAEEAIKLYHQALAIDPDDSFASEMLKRAIADSSLRFANQIQSLGSSGTETSSATTPEKRKQGKRKGKRTATAFIAPEYREGMGVNTSDEEASHRKDGSQVVRGHTEESDGEHRAVETRKGAGKRPAKKNGAGSQNQDDDTESSANERFGRANGASENSGGLDFPGPRDVWRGRLQAAVSDPGGPSGSAQAAPNGRNVEGEYRAGFHLMQSETSEALGARGTDVFVPEAYEDEDENVDMDLG